MNEGQINQIDDSMDVYDDKDEQNFDNGGDLTERSSPREGEDDTHQRNSRQQFMSGNGTSKFIKDSNKSLIDSTGSDGQASTMTEMTEISSSTRDLQNNNEKYINE